MTDKVFNNCIFGVIADTVHSLSVSIAPDGAMQVNATPVVDTVAASVEAEDLAPGGASLPEVLLTGKARELHARLCEAGMVDEGWRPVGLSNAEKGTLVEYVAERLGIRAKWKLFGSLWHTDPETLRTAKARGLDQDRTWAFRSRLDTL